jgi:ribosomal protein S6--L-glutamate ligase
MRIALLLGREPGPSSVLHDVRPLLAPAQVDLVVHAGGALPEADLLVLKDLSRQALDEVERSGRAACNRAVAARASLDKAVVVAALAAAGVPVPRSRVLRTWEQVREAAAAASLVVKPQEGTQGAGVLLLDGAAPQEPAAPGPWLVQERVEGDGLDRKLYVVGDEVRGVLRTWPAPADRSGEPFAPPVELTDVACAAARALDLEICGVDVVLTSGGPVVVDVNAFPGFKGVPGAAQLLAGYLRDVARRTEVAACA